MGIIEQQITKRVKQAIADEVFPGCVVGIVTPKDNFVFPFGYHTYKADVQVQTNTVYDIASVTKAVATHSTLLRLIDKGEVQLNDKVVDFLPHFNSGEKKQEVTIKHLLTYTVNLQVPAMSEVVDKPTEEALEDFLSAPLRETPGENFLYTNSTAILIGMVVQKASGKSLDKISQEFFFDTLGMEQTTFHPENINSDNIVPTEKKDRLGRVVHGEVHDEATYLLQQDGRYLGAAGLFSTAPDLLKYLSMLLNNGKLADAECFSSEIIDKMFSVQFSGERKIGFGWELAGKRYMGKQATENTFGVPGFTGCSLVGDRDYNAGVVLLSNRVYPQRPDGSEEINSVRQDLADIVWGHTK